MDCRRFDDLARRFAHSPSRRAFLVACASAALSVLRTPPVTKAAQSETCQEPCPEGESCLSETCSRSCTSHRDCRSKHDDPCISHTCIDGMCVEAIVDCLQGYECCTGACCTRSCTIDDDCAVFDPCRRGLCGPEGVCEFTELDPCLICAADNDCSREDLNSACCGGACRRPCPVGTAFGKGCECRADSSAELNGLVVRDDASG